ncbi:1683_t:CDS:1, partial [Acaulospora colombiana]
MSIGNPNTRQFYNLPRLPDRSLTTSNYGAASIMQPGNHKNIHQRCGDFIIEIEPYSHHPSGAGPGTMTMTTAVSTPLSSTTTWMSTPASISDGQYLSIEMARRLHDLESYAHHQSEQLKSLLWERDDLKYRNHNLEVRVEMLKEQSNKFDYVFKERESLKVQNESLQNSIQQLQTIATQSNKERDDIRGRYQLLELYLSQVQENLSGHEKLVLELNTAKNQMKEVDVENKSLREEAARLRKQNDNLAAGMGRLQDELNFFVKQRDGLSSEISNLSSKSDSMLAESDRLRQQNSKLISELEAQHKVSERLREQRDELKIQNSTLVSETDRLRNELDKYLNNMIRHRQSDSTASESTVSEFAGSEFGDEDEDCQSTTTVTSTELQNPTSQGNSDAKLQLTDDFSARKTDRGVANNDYEYEDVTETPRDMDSSYTRIGGPNEVLEKLQSQLDELALQRDDLTNENGLLKSQVENLQNERDMIREQCDQMTTKKNSLMVQLEQLQSECAEIRRHRDELISQNDVVTSNFNSLTLQLEHLQSECNHISEHRDEVTGNLKAAVDLNNSLTAQVDAIRKDRDELSRRNVLTTSQVEQLQVKLASFVQQQEDLSNEKSSLISQIEQLRKEHDLVCQQREELSAKDCASSSQLIKLQEELNDLNRKQSELSSQHNEILNKNTAMVSQLEKLQVNYDRVTKERDDLASETTTVSSRMSQLQKELDIVCQNRDESINNNNTLISQIGRLQAELDQITRSRDEVSGKNSELITQLGQVQDELNGVINRQKEEVRSLNSGLTKEINRLSEHCRALNEQNDRLQRQNYDIAAELERLRNLSGNVNAELSEVKNDIPESREKTLSGQSNDEPRVIIQPNDKMENSVKCGQDELKEQMTTIILENDDLRSQQEIGQIQEELEDVKIQRAELRNDQGRKVYEVGIPRRMSLKSQSTPITLTQPRSYQPNQLRNSDSQESLNRTVQVSPYRYSNRISMADRSIPMSTSTVRYSTYTHAQPQQTMEPNVGLSNCPEETIDWDQQASPSSSQQQTYPQRVRPQQLVMQPHLAPAVSPHVIRTSEDSGVFMSQQVHPTPISTPGQTQYYEDQNVSSPSIYKRYSTISQESFGSVPPLKASSSQASIGNVYTSGSINPRYSSVSITSVDPVNQRSSIYNVSKPLPSIPVQEQKPLKSSSESITSKKSIRLPGRLASLRNSKLPKSHKE